MQLNIISLKLRLVITISIIFVVATLAVSCAPNGNVTQNSAITSNGDNNEIISLSELGKGRIAYVWGDGENQDIYLMNLDGSERRNLTSSPSYDTVPSWSPDGKYITFESNRNNNHDIYTINIENSKLKRITSDQADDRYPSWSPDGKHLAFQSSKDVSDNIYIMDVDGSHVTDITKESGRLLNEQVGWAPDGRRVVFSGDDNLYTMNTDGSNVVRLTSNLSANAPTWSPDGSKIAFEATTPERGRDIYVIKPDGSNLKRLTNDEASDSAPTWSPDGKYIAFESSRVGPLSIYVMRADGTGTLLLTEKGQFPTWQPSGNAAVSQSGVQSTPLTATTSVVSTPDPVVTPTSNTTLPASILDEPIGSVLSGGNMRAQPVVIAKSIIGQVCPGDQALFLEQKKMNSTLWYRIRIVNTSSNCDPGRVQVNTEGWVSSVLLSTPSSTVPNSP